jgi:exosortase
MQSAPNEYVPSSPPSRAAVADLHSLWRRIPSRFLVCGLLAVWGALFHFLGTSTLGYVNTRSLFGWWVWVYTREAERPDGSIDFTRLFDGEEAHAWFIPAVVILLLWLKRDELLAISKRVWWPAIGILAVALAMHVAGYMVQQSRISLVAFFLGIYGLTGLLWGPAWLKATLFPFALFAFCVPVSSYIETVTFPLRIMATNITAVVCQTLLGINVIQDGTQLYDASRSYLYEVAAACSGIQSLTAILAFGVIYGYMTFNATWRRLVVAGSAIPLAVFANVLRLILIILAAEAFGQEAGNYVHKSTLFSIAPYVPAIGGMLFLGWWLREDKNKRGAAEAGLVTGAEQAS